MTCAATDAAGNPSPAKAFTVTVQDTIAPSCTATASPSSIRPANLQLVTIQVTITSSDSGPGVAAVVLVAVASNEPDNGLGDGDAAGDIQGWTLGAVDMTGQVRAERSGMGNGRVYTFTYRVTDIAGNASSCTTFVEVPKGTK